MHGIWTLVWCWPNSPFFLNHIPKPSCDQKPQKMHTVCKGKRKVLEWFTDSSWQQLPEDPLIHDGAGLAHASRVAGSPGSPLILAFAAAAGSFLSTARHLNSSSFFASTVFWLAVWFSCQLEPVLNHLCRAILQCVRSSRKVWAAAMQLMNPLGFPYLSAANRMVRYSSLWGKTKKKVFLSYKWANWAFCCDLARA